MESLAKTLDQDTKETHVSAHTLKPEEADEPLLQENPDRFVIFPIKYHEVSTKCPAGLPIH